MTRAAPLRVALLQPTYWPEVRRGSERFAHDLGSGLARRGHEVRLVTSHRGRPSVSVEDGIEVTRVRRLPDGRLRRRLYEDHLTHVPFAARAITGEPLAHALFHTDAAAARRAGVPHVYTFMGIPHRRGLANRRGRLELVRRAIEGAGATVALSAAAARGFERWLGVMPRVIHPGVDLAAFTPGGERGDAFTVVCPAALDAPHKRPALLLEAFALVRRQRRGARLIVDARSAPALGPVPGVEARDLDDHAALLAAYREAHVCALASRDEAFGLVLVEALACGTPAVASDDGAGPEITDTTFAGDDPAALATAILAAADQGGEGCRERAAWFSLDRCLDAHEALYRELVH